MQLHHKRKQRLKAKEEQEEYMVMPLAADNSWHTLNKQLWSYSSYENNLYRINIKIQQIGKE